MASPNPEIRVAVMESRLDNHEKICGDRYQEISENFKTVTAELKRIYYTVITAAGAAAVWLLLNGRPWEKVGS